jgi:hypothetical protein
LNTGDHGNDSSDGSGWVLLLYSLDERLNGNIEHESSLVLLVDAHEKSIEVEFSTEGREDTLHNFSFLHLAILGSEHWKLFVTENGLGSGFPDLESEVSPLFIVVVRDGGLDLSIDLDTVDHKILSNVVNEGGWAIEGSDNLFKFDPVGLDGSAVFHA